MRNLHFFNNLPKTIKKIVLIGFTTGVLSFFIILGLMFHASTYEAAAGHDAIVVLGAGLRGDVVPTMLASRLNAAIAYAEENPDAIMVMSGGQGKDELVSEAFAMKKYAAERGIDPDRILMEDKSTSTGENFKFSKVVLDEYFQDTPYTIVYVTNDYHILRAGICASRVGFDYESISANARSNKKYAYVAREYLAVLKYWLISI